MIERLLAADAALDRDELEIAHRLFAQVAEADPRNAIALVGLARVAARMEAPDEARALARRALDLDPDEAAARRLLAELDAAVSLRQPGAPPATAPEMPPAPEPERPAAPVAAPVAVSATRRARTGWRRWLDRILRRG